MPGTVSAANDFPVREQMGEVVSNVWINPEYKHLVISCERPATNAMPGQFFHLLCPHSQEGSPFLRRPMSVYRIDREGGRIEFLYKITGPGTHGIAGLDPGDRLNILGPLGVGFWLDPAWRSIVVVGRGVGLATLAPLADAAQAREIRVTALLSARNPNLLMSVEMFLAKGAHVITVTDKEGTSGPAHVERLLRELIGKGLADAFFTCGSTRLLLLLQRLGHEYGIPGQVALEQQMACGLGMCFCCVRDFRVNGATVYRRVCWEGPVFDLQEALAW